MKVVKSIPHLTYIAVSPRHPNNNCILADGAVVHRIRNMNEFYYALGYTDDMHENGIEPEFYRWSVFSKDNSIKSAFCLQNKIAAYLNKHSASFRGKYGAAYEGCASENLQDECVSCRTRPGHKAVDSTKFDN